MIRDFISSKYGNDIASKVRILYGGSVKPSNSRDLLVQPDIDGALVGGAALDVMQFADIIRSAH
ncbi:MAG TPA: triose-phosphate isomerase [bacterium]|nr:triose-phosphate isomerase [bacterium]